MSPIVTWVIGVLADFLMKQLTPAVFATWKGEIIAACQKIADARVGQPDYPFDQAALSVLKTFLGV